MSSVNTVQPKNIPELTFLFALSLFALFYDVHVRRGVGGDKIWLRRCLSDLSKRRQAAGRRTHTGERLLSELAASQTPPGALIGCQSPACVRANRVGEESESAVET